MEVEQLSTLVEQAKIRDGGAVTRLYEEYHNGVYFLCLKIVKNEDDALDLVQDSFLQAFNKLDTLQDPARFGPWLNQIAANKCRDYLKKKKPTLFSQQQSGGEDDDEENPEMEDRDESLIPDKALDTEETRRLIMGIIDGLPDLQRMAVMLYYYEEKSIRDISEIMECSENTVKSRLNYARKQIREGVLDLEKKGTKLYGVMPMLFPIIRHAASDFTLPSGASPALLGKITSSFAAGPVQGTAGAASVETSQSTISHAAAKTSAAVRKAVTGFSKLSLPVKVGAGVAAAAVVAGVAVFGGRGGVPASSPRTAAQSVAVKQTASASGKAVSKPLDEKTILYQYLASLPRKTQNEQKAEKNADVSAEKHSFVSFTVTRTLVGSKILDCNADGHRQLLLKYLHQSGISGKVVTIPMYTVIGVDHSTAKPLLHIEIPGDDTLNHGGMYSYNQEFLIPHQWLSYKEAILQNKKTKKIYLVAIDNGENVDGGEHDTLFSPLTGKIVAQDDNNDGAKHAASMKSLKTDYTDISETMQWDPIK